MLFLTNMNMKQSSTYRKLKAVDFALKSFSLKLGSRYVKLYSDNQNVVRIINIGSMKMDLQEIALSIFHNCLKYNIFLDVAWVPRSLNTEADFYCKMFDYDDWQVHESVFKYFDKIWCPYTFDRFADCNNVMVL